MEYMQDLVALNRKKRTGGGQALCNLWSRYAPSPHSGSGRLSEWGKAVIRKHLEQIF